MGQQQSRQAKKIFIAHCCRHRHLKKSLARHVRCTDRAGHKDLRVKDVEKKFRSLGPALYMDTQKNLPSRTIGNDYTHSFFIPSKQVYDLIIFLLKGIYVVPNSNIFPPVNEAGL